MTDERERDSERQGGLEDCLRGHYQTLGPGSSILLTRRIAELLDRSPRRRPLLHFPTGRWSIARLAAGAAVLVVMALLAAPLLFGPSEPIGGRPTSTATPSRTPLPIAPTESISPTTMPTPDPSVVLAGARTQALGRMRRGGAFWDQDYTIWRAPDASSTYGDSPWPQSDTTPQAIFVLDRGHIWTITLGPGSSNPYGGQGPGFDHLKAVVNRSAVNGAPEWRQANVPGDYPDSMLSLSFVDELHGFLMASGGASQFASTILRTGDGGATWRVVATIKTGGVLGGWFTASDDSTLWAGAQAEASSHGHPLLSVSRNGGKTWSEVKLPGMAAYPGGIDAYLDQAPVFLDSRTGFVSVDYGNANGSGVAVFVTVDAGLTWSRVEAPSKGISVQPSVDFIDATHWVTSVGSSVASTSDGGTTWKTTAVRGPDSGPTEGDWVKLVFFDPLNGYGLFEPAGQGLLPTPRVRYLYQTTSGGLSWDLVSSRF